MWVGDKMEKDNLRIRVTLGLILITIGIFAFLSNYIEEKRELVFSSMNLELSNLINNDEAILNNEEQIEEVEQQQEQQQEQQIQEQAKPQINYETYIGILDIPKIGFNKGFYKKESNLNNVKINIKILPVSDYPDKEKGNVIIIGHSGNYNNSYFANLYQLAIDDTASITYNNKKYTYKIVNIYRDTKDGTVTVYRNENKSTLTLITCTKDDSTSQTIYILELVNVE